MTFRDRPALAKICDGFYDGFGDISLLICVRIPSLWCPVAFLFWAPFSSRLLAWLEVAAKSGFPVRACPLCGDEKRHARVCWLGWPQLLFPACRVVKVTAAGAICVSAGLRSCAEALSCFPPDAIWAPEYCITCLAAGCSARHFMERQIARALNSDELSPFLPCGQQRRCREA